MTTEEPQEMSEADWEAYCEENEPPAADDDEGLFGTNYGGALW